MLRVDARPRKLADSILPDTVYRTSVHCDLLWRDWGGDSLVYDQHAGHTHQFSPLAAAVMACFEERACTLHDIADQLGLAGEADGAGGTINSHADDVFGPLQAVVQQFIDLGWIVAARTP